MARATNTSLILGGHSFISQLGSDPAASEREQRCIAESCLDNGIAWFDTTYMPERVALGKILRSLERRSEAALMAWNFFTDFLPGDPVGEPEYYRPGHIDLILEQLQTNYVDVLVVLPMDDPGKNARQQELAIDWQNKGYARALALWVADTDVMEHHGAAGPFQFAIQPCNITTPDAAAAFSACKAIGWDTIATSPFFRGWELDRIVMAASARGLGSPAGLRPLIADLMLRYALFQPGVDRLVVTMRKTEWVERNLKSAARGPLTADEVARLQQLRAAAYGKTSRWERLRRRFLRAPPSG